MAEHTKASTQGSAHARYVAYREAGYSPRQAYEFSGGFWAHLDDPDEPHDDDHAYPLTSGGAGQDES